MDVKERRSAKSMGHRKFLFIVSTRLVHLLPFKSGRMVGQGRLELPTSRLSVVRSNQLSYKPR